MLRNKLNLKAKSDQVGWIIAAAFAGVMLASGFQSTNEKIAVVDLLSIANKSNAGVADAATFDKLKASRQDLLGFIEKNPVMTVEQSQQLFNLVSKEALTDADNATITKVKNDVQNSMAQFVALDAKANLTADESALVAEFRQRVGANQAWEREWYDRFMGFLRDWSENHRAANLEKARSAVNQVAKAQGFTLVFDKSIAPYGANDLTDAALQAMNAQK